MLRFYVTLAEYPMDMVRFCTKCERRGLYSKATLIEHFRRRRQHGGLELAAGCPKIAANKITDLCGVYYPDRVPYSPPSG
jgi:hypothetical protein